LSGLPILDLTPGNDMAQGMFRALFAGRFYPDLAAASPADVRWLDRPVPDDVGATAALHRKAQQSGLRRVEGNQHQRN
jgi:hypothetical protein